MTDISGADNLLNATGHNGAQPNRVQKFTGVLQGTRYRYPPLHPMTKKRLFRIRGGQTRRRTATTITRAAETVEAARRAGRSNSAVDAPAKESGIKGCSVFFCSSTSNKRTFPALQYFPDMGPAAPPHNTMHLVLVIVVRLLWSLSFGASGVTSTTPEPYKLSPEVVVAIGREQEAGYRTVPQQQTRALRNIATHSASFKAVDWMYFLLCTGNAVLADRLPDPFFKISHAFEPC